MVTLGARGSSAERSRALCIWGLETSKALSGEQLVLRLLCLHGAGPVAWAWFAHLPLRGPLLRGSPSLAPAAAPPHLHLSCGHLSVGAASPSAGGRYLNKGTDA